MFYDVARPEEKMLVKSAKGLGVELKPVYTDDTALRLVGEAPSKYGDASLIRCTGYYRGLYCAAFTESLGIPTVNSLRILYVGGDKALTTLALAAAHVPTPKTTIAFSEKGIKDGVQEMGYPVVFKPLRGSWGRLLSKVNDWDAAYAILEHRKYMENPLMQIIYMQEYVEKPPRDIRVFVIGDQAVAAIYRHSHEDDWRTNLARGGRGERLEVNGEVGELAVKATKCLGSGVYGVDMMETPDGLVVHEVNVTLEFKSTVGLTGTDIPRMILEYVVEKVKR